MILMILESRGITVLKKIFKVLTSVPITRRKALPSLSHCSFSPTGRDGGTWRDSGPALVGITCRKQVNEELQDQGGSGTEGEGQVAGRGAPRAETTAPLSLFFVAFGFLLISLLYEMCYKYTARAHWVFKFWILRVLGVLCHKPHICVLLSLQCSILSEETYVQNMTLLEWL